MGNGTTIAKNMSARATNESKSISKVDRCGKAVTKFVTDPSKKEGLYKAMEELNGRHSKNITEIKKKFEEKRDAVISERNKRIDDIKKNASTVLIVSDMNAEDSESKKLEQEADVSITAGKQMKVVLDNAKVQIRKMSGAIYKMENTERKLYHSEALIIAKEAVGTKDRIKEIMGAMGEIVGKAAYAVRNEPIKAAVGTALVAVGATVATGPVGVMTAIGAVTAVYGVSTLWKCGPAHVTLKKLEQIKDYSEKSE